MRWDEKKNDDKWMPRCGNKSISMMNVRHSVWNFTSDDLETAAIISHMISRNGKCAIKPTCLHSFIFFCVSAADRRGRLSAWGKSFMRSTLIYDAKSFDEIGIIEKYWHFGVQKKVYDNGKKYTACNFIVDEGIVQNIYQYLNHWLK